MRKRLPVITLACLAIAAGACGPQEDAGPALGRPTVTLSRPRAALGSPIEVTYEFVVAPDARFDGDYRVFVHFVDSDGELMWTDDHMPPTPTSRWKPGETIEYTRTMFLPIYPYVGEAAVVIGLYGGPSGGRLKLEGTEHERRGYVVAKLELLPQTENVFLIYKDGWHPAEIAPDNAAVEWQWTKKEATLAFRNPRRDSTLYLHLDGRSPIMSDPQVVTVMAGGQLLESFTVAERGEQIRRVRLTASQLGATDMVELRISVDRTFVPALVANSGSRDQRELGIRVFHAFVDPQ